MKSAAGQASIEMMGGALVVLLAGLVVAQLFVGGQQRLWLDAAAKTGALAVIDGEDPGEAVRETLPGRLRNKVAVRTHDMPRDMVRVEVTSPAAGPLGMLGLVPPLHATATAMATGSGGSG